ncbi:MAG: WXG100 family type VII secretion target [Bacilli bacterium]
MGEKINVDYEQIENYCNELYKLLDELKATKENFHSSVKKIKSGGIWEGEAADAFVKRCDKTIKASNAMEEALKNAILYITSCSENYKTSESAVSSGIENKLIKG